MDTMQYLPRIFLILSGWATAQPNLSASQRRILTPFNRNGDLIAVARVSNLEPVVGDPRRSANLDKYIGALLYPRLSRG